MATTIRSSKGITIGGSNQKYGGYAFNASYSISFGGPSRLTISFLSESGEYNETQLKSRIGFQGAKVYDSIRVGEWGPLLMHPLAYTIQEQPSGNVLQVTYYDRSINYLDKYFVLLDKRNVPTEEMNEKLRKDLDGDKHIIIVGNEYIKDPSARGVKTQNQNEQSRTIRGEVLYTPEELVAAIKAKGRIGGKLDAAAMKILVEFGAMSRDEDGNLKKGGDNKKRQGYLFGFNGSLRTVLNAWGQKLGFATYWDPIRDKIRFIDLRAGVTYQDMNRVIEAILNKGKNIIGRNYTYSIEDTFSQGASAYFGRDGEEDGKSVSDKKYLLDILNFPIFKCHTEPYREIDGEKVYYDYKYIPQTEQKGIAEPDRRPWEHYYPDRTDFAYVDYVRLVKAAACGADFFATYVLMKKIANKPFQEGTGNFKSPNYLSYWPGNKPNINAAANNLARDVAGKDIEDSVGYPVFPNFVVDELFKSSGSEAVAGGTRQKLNKQGAGGDWIYGDDCLTARLLNPALMTSSQIKSDLNVDAALMAILHEVFMGDSSQPNIWNFGAFAGIGPNSFDSSTGAIKGMHIYPLLNRIYMARVSDYAISSLLEKPDNNHQFQQLSAIAQAAGRFYVGRDMVTPREFKTRNYVEDKPSLFNRDLDVKDTPLSELYEGIDPTHGAAAKSMPNSLITELRMHNFGEADGFECCQITEELGTYGVDKDRPSKQKDYRVITGPDDEKDPCNVFKGEEFSDPFNTARPTVEQFICALYRCFRMMDYETEAAQFDGAIPAVVAGEAGKWKIGVDTVAPTKGGSGYSVTTKPGGGNPIMDDIKFVAFYIKNGKKVEVPPTEDPIFTATLSKSVIINLHILDKGLWESDEALQIEIRAEEPKGGPTKTNIFGNEDEEVMNRDSIRRVNLDQRQNTLIEQCCPIDQDPNVLLFDEGSQVVIPELIRPHLDRIGKFGNNPIDLSSNNLQNYLKDSYAVLLPFLYTMKELEEKYGRSSIPRWGTPGQPGDELDWIVDQVEIGGTFFEALGDGSNLIITESEGEGEGETIFCGPKDLVYLVKGDKFEYTHIIRPDQPHWNMNVREDQFGSPKGTFLTPSLEDLGIVPEECCPGTPEMKEECEEEKEEEIKKAIADFCKENTFDVDEPRNGLTVTLAGTSVNDAQGNPVSFSTKKGSIRGFPHIEDGLEKLEVSIDGNGETTSMTVSAKRKVRIFKTAENRDKFIRLVGPNVENKLLGQ